MSSSFSTTTNQPPKTNRPTRGIAANDVSRVADQLLRQGERPTIEKIRVALGTGSPNTINPLLDAWWKSIGQRLDAGPSALHRLPEGVAQVAEALWMQALEDARGRADIERGGEARSMERNREALELRSHVLSLREGELDNRLKDRERSLRHLEEQTRALGTLLRKEQATRAAGQTRIADLENEIETLRHRLTLVLSKAIAKAHSRGSPQKRTRHTSPRQPTTRRRKANKTSPKTSRMKRKKVRI